MLSPFADSWTVRFLRSWRPYLTYGSIWALRRHMSNGRPLSLTLRRPRGAITIRPQSTDLYTFEAIFVNGLYDSATKRGPLSTVIDVGSCAGYFTLFIAAHHPKARFYVVEPAPENVAVLGHHLASLGEQCTIDAAALWDRHELVNLLPPQEDGGFTQFSCRAGDGNVQGRPMQEIFELSGFDTIDMLKVDAEGGEAHLFSGALDWLSATKAIAIEFHKDSRSACDFDRVMRSHGFVIDEAPDRETVLAFRP